MRFFGANRQPKARSAVSLPTAALGLQATGSSARLPADRGYNPHDRSSFRRNHSRTGAGRLRSIPVCVRPRRPALGLQ